MKPLTIKALIARVISDAETAEPRVLLAALEDGPYLVQLMELYEVDTEENGVSPDEHVFTLLVEAAHATISAGGCN